MTETGPDLARLETDGRSPLAALTEAVSEKRTAEYALAWEFHVWRA